MGRPFARLGGRGEICRIWDDSSGSLSRRSDTETWALDSDPGASSARAQDGAKRALVMPRSTDASRPLGNRPEGGASQELRSERETLGLMFPVPRSLQDVVEVPSWHTILGVCLKAP